MEVVTTTTTTTDCLTKKRIRPQPLESLPNKRIRRLQPPRTPSWADDLPTDLLETIMSKLTFFDVQIFKAVCSSWRQAASSFHHSPLLMLPSLPPFFKTRDVEETAVVANHKSVSIFFYALKQKSFYEYKNMPDIFHDSWCVGSSNGFLILLDKNANPYLLNLFSRRLIVLPPKEKIPHISSVHHNDEHNCVKVVYKYHINAFHSRASMPFDEFRKSELIQKAVLSDDNNFVIIMYGMFSGIGYCRQSDSNWTNLDALKRRYSDILCSKNMLYALSQDRSIQMWDFNGSSPVKKIDIDPSLSEPSSYLSRDLYTTHCCLVESRGDILLVVRYVGEFVKDGKPIYEGDLLTDEDTQPLICPYETLDFKVYKIDFKLKELSRLESLGDRALFLGGNHASSLSVDEYKECEGNSIYFTDNYWERMDEDYLYGGHDMGVYSMENGSVRQFFEINEMKIQPPPFWVFPCTPTT